MGAIDVELKPFMTPNYAIEKSQERKYQVGEVDANTLSDMCDYYRTKVFVRAGKSDPKRQEITGV